MKLHSTSIATTAFALLAGIAAAHADGMDMPAHGSLKDLPPPTVVAAPWDGRYIGATLGGAVGRFKNDTCSSDVLGAGQYGLMSQTATADPGYYFWKAGDQQALCDAGHQKANAFGVIGGLHMGFNKQTGQVVFGVETDVSGMGLSKTTTTTGLTGAVQQTYIPGSTGTVRSSSSADGLFTFRARAGITQNNWLFYATGGLAVTSLSGSFNYSDTVTSAQESADFRKLVAGFAYGAGAEKQLGGGWSLKGEWLHLDFGKVSVTSNNLGGNNLNLVNNHFVYKPETYMTHSSKLDGDVFRVGLSYKFQ